MVIHVLSPALPACLRCFAVMPPVLLEEGRCSEHFDLIHHPRCRRCEVRMLSAAKDAGTFVASGSWEFCVFVAAAAAAPEEV